MIKQTLVAAALGVALTASWAQDINFGIISTESSQNLKSDWQPIAPLPCKNARCPQ